MKSIRSVAMLVWPALLFISEPTFAAYSCSVSSGGSINFLTYDPNTAPPTANTTITLACNHLSGGNENISWTMTLSNGSSGTCLGPAGRTMQRQASPAATIGYNIYQNSTSIVWGNAGCGTYPGGTMSVNNGHPLESTIQTLRGVMPAGQLVPSGTYLETLVLTVTF